jgi:PBP1b-binding outer membrane lipoprotein LpoB
MRSAAMAAVLVAIALGGCKVNDAGAPPTVDVKDKGDGATIEVQPGRMPDVEVTDSLKMPNVEMPDVKVPEVKAPDVDMPDVKLPEVKAPDVKLPDLDGDRNRGRARTDTTRRP